MKNLLICGDSFAADWTVKYSAIGWPNLLAQEFNVVNLAQAGCSEYKIFKQLLTADLENFDCVIISHTSPNRIYVKTHPVHHSDMLHKHSDLIYADIVEHSKQNKSLVPIIEYYEKYFDQEYADFVHSLICEKIYQQLLDFQGQVIHMSHIPWQALYQFPNMINLDLFASQSGHINHYNQTANNQIYQIVRKKINNE